MEQKQKLKLSELKDIKKEKYHELDISEFDLEDILDMGIDLNKFDLSKLDLVNTDFKDLGVKKLNVLKIDIDQIHDSFDLSLLDFSKVKVAKLDLSYQRDKRILQLKNKQDQQNENENIPLKYGDKVIIKIKLKNRDIKTHGIL